MANPFPAARWLVALLAAVAVAVTGCSSGAQMAGVTPGSPSTDSDLPPHVTGEILVKFHPGADTTAALAAAGATVLYRIPRIDVWVLRLSGGRSIIEAAKTLQQRQDVWYAEPNYLALVPETSRPGSDPTGLLPALKPPTTALTPNDPAYPAKLWGLVKINAASAWDVTTGGSNVVIAVLDTGVDATHPDLSGKVLTGANCLSGTCISGGTSDGHGHGTHVAGTAGALGNNGVGVIGVAFNSATQILPVKVLSDSGSGSFAGIAAGIAWAADTITAMGKKGVLNMSLGGFGYSQSLQDAVVYALGVANGSILVVAAMGNEFKRWGTTFPAALPGVMAVGATDGNDNKVDFSNMGPHISVTAPGRDIYSSLPGSTYAYFSGTSMASPHVTGLAALVWSANPGFNNYQVRRAVEVGATDRGTSGWDEVFGWGRINALSAVTTVPAPYYGCANVAVQTAGPTTQPNSDVVLTGVGIKRTARTDATGPTSNTFFDWLPAGTYTVTASRVIGGIGNYGTATVTFVATMNPNACSSVTITMAP